MMATAVRPRDHRKARSNAVARPTSPPDACAAICVWRIVDSLVAPADELLAWSQTQPRTIASREEYLRRLADLLRGRWSRWISFAQQNQPALREHIEVGQRMQSRLLLLCAPVIEPGDTVHDQLRSLLALLAVYLGNLAPAASMLRSLGLQATAEDLSAAAMDVAHELVGQRTRTV